MKKKSHSFYLTLALFSRTIFLLVLLCLTVQLPAQNLKYEIRAIGLNLGNAYAGRKIVGSEVHYTMDSQVNVKLWFTDYIIQYNSEAIYEKDILKSCHVLAKVNDKIKEEIFIKKVATGYSVTRTEDDKTDHWILNDREINFSTSKLFWHKPENGNKSLAENYGIICSTSHTKNPAERIVYDEKTKSKTVYTYQGVRPIKRMVEYPVVNFYMTLIEELP